MLDDSSSWQNDDAGREEGTLPGRVLKVDRLVNRHLTRAQASELSSYEPGDAVVFHADAYGCRTNDVCTVTGKRVLIGVEN